MNVARKSTRNGPPKRVHSTRLKSPPPPPPSTYDEDVIDKRKRKMSTKKRPSPSSNASVLLKKKPRTPLRIKLKTTKKVPRVTNKKVTKVSKTETKKQNKSPKDASNKTTKKPYKSSRYKGSMAKKLEISQRADWLPAETPEGWRREVVPRSLGSYIITKRIADVYYFYQKNDKEIKFRSKQDIKKFILKNNINLDENLFYFSVGNFVAYDLPTEPERLRMKKEILTS
ncbi:unnamed protein product [Dimorphilus gyrociliatus]|nr:unnamed protein product [Dimorphilus gyrociliatus]